MPKQVTGIIHISLFGGHIILVLVEGNIRLHKKIDRNRRKCKYSQSKNFNVESRFVVSLQMFNVYTNVLFVRIWDFYFVVK